MPKDLFIMLAQINPVVGDISYNHDKILDVWSKAPEDTDLILFPELALSGYPPEDLVFNADFIDTLQNNIENLIEKSKTLAPAILVGSVWENKGKLYNAAHLIHDGALVATCTKHNLPCGGYFDQRRLFTPGPVPTPVSFEGHRLGILIGDDLYATDISKTLKDKGADVLLACCARPFESSLKDKRLYEAKARARETGLPLVCVNLIGGQDTLVFDGDSFALNPKGDIIQQLKLFEEQTKQVSFPLQEAPAPDSLYHAPQKQSDEILYQALALGLKDYVNKNGFPGIILGLSGGLDSGLSLAIAVDALGPDRVQAVRLPSKYTSQASLDDAAEEARLLGVQLDTISIESTVEHLETVLKDHTDPATSPVTFENLQSRARGIILMALSNTNGKMLLATGNKSEVAMGYATLYGDMCGGFNVLGDIYKTRVFALARWRNTQGMAIPERVITRPPSAELRPDQKDQDTLPPYDLLDSILYMAIEERKSAKEIIKSGYDKETVKRTLMMMDRAEYKRRQAAPAVKVTASTFCDNRRYPITNHFAGH